MFRRDRRERFREALPPVAAEQESLSVMAT
jgi:hypothetical protein